jgi:hypothetical protein
MTLITKILEAGETLVGLVLAVALMATAVLTWAG